MKPSVQFFSLCGVFLLAWFSQFPLALAEEDGAEYKPAPQEPTKDDEEVVRLAPPPPVELDHNDDYSSDYFPYKPDILYDGYKYGFPYPFYQNHHHSYPHHPKPYLPKPHHPHTPHFPHYPNYPCYPHKPTHPYPYYPITLNCHCRSHSNPHHPTPYLPKPHHPHTPHYPHYPNYPYYPHKPTHPYPYYPITHYPNYPCYPHKPTHPYPYYPITLNCICRSFYPYEYDTYKKPYYLN